MKRTIAIFTVLVLCFGLCACVSDAPEETKGLADLAAEAVATHVRTHIYFTYETDSTTMCTTDSVTEISSNVFKVYGTASISSAGKRFNRSYQGIATYDPTTEKFRVDFDLK